MCQYHYMIALSISCTWFIILNRMYCFNHVIGRLQWKCYVIIFKLFSIYKETHRGWLTTLNGAADSTELLEKGGRLRPSEDVKHSGIDHPHDILAPSFHTAPLWVVGEEDSQPLKHRGCDEYATAWAGIKLRGGVDTVLLGRAFRGWHSGQSTVLQLSRLWFRIQLINMFVGYVSDVGSVEAIELGSLEHRGCAD